MSLEESALPNGEAVEETIGSNVEESSSAVPNKGDNKSVAILDRKSFLPALPI